MSGDGSIYRRVRQRPSGEVYVRWVAQAILRHATSGMTLNVYTHVTADLERAAVDQMDRMVEGA